MILSCLGVLVTDGLTDRWTFVLLESLSHLKIPEIAKIPEVAKIPELVAFTWKALK